MKYKQTYLAAFIIVSFLLSSFIPAAFAEDSAPKKEFTEKILAVVNGEAITQTDVDEILAPIYLQYKSTYQGKELETKMAEARKDILNQLIEDKLILQEAKKESISVDDKEVDNRIEDLKKNFATIEDFDQALKNQNITLLDLRNRYREQLMIKKAVAKEVLSKIIISPIDISEYYKAHQEDFKVPEQIHLRSIFLTVDDKKPAEEVAAKANTIYDNLQSGVPFVEMVEKYSEAPNVVDAGDMGFMKRGSMRPEIEDVVFKLKPGEYTKPIKTASGYYLFRVEEKEPEKILDLTKVQDKIRDKLYQQEVKKRLDNWIKKLKETSLIEVKTDEKKEKS